MNKEIIIVSGPPRCGTSFIGNLIASESCCIEIYEPFKYSNGLCGVDVWYPYFNDFNHKSVVDDFITGHARYRLWNRSSKPGRRRFWAGLRSFCRKELKYFYALYGKEERIVVKDPMATFMAPYFVEKVGAKVVFMLKHPLAFFASNKRQSWDVDLSHLLKQINLVDAEIPEFKKLLDSYNSLNYPERIAVLWCCLFSFTVKRLRNANNFRLLMHEEFIENPHAQWQDLAKWLGLKPTQASFNFLDESYVRGKDVDPTKVRDFQRDPALMRKSWVREVDSKEYEAIRRICYEVSLSHYPAESWNKIE